MGYVNVQEYAGGKKEWMEAGLPMEGEASWLRAQRQEKDKAA